MIDESHLHKGHHGARPGGETHYRVRIASAAFRGKSRIEMHRAINALLADELAAQVHALAIEGLGRRLSPFMRCFARARLEATSFLASARPMA